jgi:hypothetical protein
MMGGKTNVFKAAQVENSFALSHHQIKLFLIAISRTASFITTSKRKEE